MVSSEEEWAQEYSEHTLSSGPIVSATLLVTCRAFFDRHVRTVIRMTKAAKYIMLYYLGKPITPPAGDGNLANAQQPTYTQHRSTLFAMTTPLTNVSTTTLSRVVSRWLSVCDDIPFGVFRILTHKTYEALSRFKTHNYEELMQSIHNGTTMIQSKTVQMCQMMKQYDHTVRLLLEQSLELHVGQYTREDVTQLVHILHLFVTHHKLMVDMREVPGVVHLVKCALLMYFLEWFTDSIVPTPATPATPTSSSITTDGYHITHKHTHTSATNTTNTPPICAICYNTETAPFQRLHCGHHFHTCCLFRSVQLAAVSSPSHPPCVGKCPYCMQPIDMHVDTMLDTSPLANPTPTTTPATTTPPSPVTTSVTAPSDTSPLIHLHQSFQSLHQWWMRQEYASWVVYSGQVVTSDDDDDDVDDDDDDEDDDVDEDEDDDDDDEVDNNDNDSES